MISQASDGVSYERLLCTEDHEVVAVAHSTTATMSVYSTQGYGLGGGTIVVRQSRSEEEGREATPAPSPQVI